jgi:tripartite-type tricarboxylate transporter receptor subunit TctC
MPTTRLTRRTFVSAGAALAAVRMTSAHAQTSEADYPRRAVTIVNPFTPGSISDAVARIIGQSLQEQFGQPFVVENKVGGGGLLAGSAVARAAPDGYTLLLTPEHTFTVNPFLYRKLPYDPVQDFVPITGVVNISQALVAHPSLPARTVADMIALAKDRPGELNYGSLGVGSGPHLSMELLQSMTGAKLNAIHYKGAAPALTDVIAGHVPMMFVSTGLIVQPWKAGQLQALGVGSSERLPQLPQLPTVGETLPGFTAVVWFGLFAPNGTPPQIVAKINDAVQRILSDRDFRERFLTPNFYEPISSSPQEFANHIRSDAARWRQVISDARIAIDE